ncbi:MULTISPECIES: ATP-binding cassette domain-containing protein [unclassified Streptomyces]|uniref:ATP-binding cassette domain-containing protein n=1 Tax=unclassified Streptomyces TaxID=2593676 RepID=UPI00081EC087|nr:MULTISPECIES: ATP-binding cassette domain-containing protein [unclassified Streptomyces]MYZ39250.1 ATP-binding cassette domain-containing protein [Streptomyces sp. SID4917]SCG02944.1 ABC-type multidrug transport system, ATPase component [Streptomyces sp. MnatMP-M17]
MLQAIGLTSTPRRDLTSAVDDLTFDARPGSVTALLGASGAGKTTALRLMLELQPGRGITYFRGRPLHRIAHPAREIGVLLGDVPGHPGRTVRGQLRMLGAAAGVPASRADELLDVVGLQGLRDERLGTLSVGMERRLGLATALLGDPHTLLLDAPSGGLSLRETSWLFGLLSAHAAQGGTVLYTTDDPKEAARTADHVVTIDDGRLVADQDGAAFARTRLRPRVAVRTPHAARLADVLSREARASRRSVEVVTEAGSRLTVFGSTCPEIGEAAFRHGILVHQLADEFGDTGPGPVPRLAPVPAAVSVPVPGPGSNPGSGSGPGSSFRTVSVPGPARVFTPRQARAEADTTPTEAVTTPHTAPHATPQTAPHATPHVAPDAETHTGPHTELRAEPAPDGLGPLPPPLSARPVRSPLRPVRYELRRMLGVPSTHLIVAAVLVASTVLAVTLAHSGRTPLPGLLSAWPGLLPLPPAALGAGLLGALSFGHEFRYPALADARGTVPRRLGLLLAKSVVMAASALLLTLLAVVADFGVLRLVYGAGAAPVPDNWLVLGTGWVGLAVGSAWAGLLAAGVFRAAVAGVAAVIAVPTLVVPLLQVAFSGPSARSMAGLPGRLRELAWLQWPGQVDRWLMVAVRLMAQPVAAALTLSLSVLLCAYLLTGLRRRARWRPRKDRSMPSCPQVP